MNKVVVDPPSIDDLVENHGWSRDVVVRLSAVGWDYEKFLNTDLWSRRYLNEGQLWGQGPSDVAKYLISSADLDPGSKIFELGPGYGRDMLYLAEEGNHTIHGIENAIDALSAASAKIHDYIAQGSVAITIGDIKKTPLLRHDFHDAAMAHRVFHLFKPEQRKQIAARLASTLKPNGLLVLSSRCPSDYNDKQMEWIEEGVSAKYTLGDRAGHEVNFINEEIYVDTFGEYFNIVSFQEGEEIESMSNSNEKSCFLTMVAHKKTPEEIAAFHQHSPA